MSSSHFDSIADRYDDSLPAHVVEHYLRKRVAFIREHCSPGSALDVGCGTGMLATRLAAEGYEMTGLDPSEGMLAVLRERTGSVRPVKGSASELPFEADSFDLVYTVATMHHIAGQVEVRHALREMVRVARPGGRILVWDHNPRNPYWSRLMARVPQDTGEERLIPAHEITGGLRDAGGRVLLSIQSGLVPDFTPRQGLRATARIERALERTPLVRRFAAHNVVLATK